jgi:transcriptional regulator with XRE-family HTH domain
MKEEKMRGRISMRDAAETKQVHLAFSERIMALQDMYHLNMHQLSKLCGLSHANFIAWMDGKQSPSAASLLRVADRCDVSIDWLLGRTDAPRCAKGGKK